MAHNLPETSVYFIGGRPCFRVLTQDIIPLVQQGAIEFDDVAQEYYSKISPAQLSLKISKLIGVASGPFR